MELRYRTFFFLCFGMVCLSNSGQAQTTIGMSAAFSSSVSDSEDAVKLAHDFSYCYDEALKNHASSSGLQYKEISKKPCMYGISGNLAEIRGTFQLTIDVKYCDDSYAVSDVIKFEKLREVKIDELKAKAEKSVELLLSKITKEKEKDWERQLKEIEKLFERIIHNYPKSSYEEMFKAFDAFHKLSEKVGQSAPSDSEKELIKSKSQKINNYAIEFLVGKAILDIENLNTEYNEFRIRDRIGDQIDNRLKLEIEAERLRKISSELQSPWKEDTYAFATEQLLTAYMHLEELYKHARLYDRAAEYKKLYNVLNQVSP